MILASEAGTLSILQDSSSSSGSRLSNTSQASRASSFAHLLRSNRADTRLLKKSSQPREHLTQHPPLSRHRPTELRRKSSYHAPKVVEDTAVIPSQASPLHPSHASLSLTATDFIKAVKPPAIGSLKAPQLRPAPLPPLRKTKSSSSTDRSFPPSPLLSPLQLSTAPEQPGLARSPTWKDVPQPPLLRPILRQAHIETPSKARSSSREGSRERSAPRPRPQLSFELPKLDVFVAAQHYHNITPPEAEPAPPGHALFRHGDHYFRTFAPETVYVKEFTPTMIPTGPDYFRRDGPSIALTKHLPLALRPTTPEKLLAVTATQPSTPVRPSPTRLPTYSPPGTSKRKRSSCFQAFRKFALTDSTYEAPYSGMIGTAPPARPTPGIMVSAPLTPNEGGGFRGLSDLPLPPYFARPKRQTSSEATSSSLISPMDTSHDPSRKRKLEHSRSSTTEELSHLSEPRSTSKLRHRHTLESIEDTDLPLVQPNSTVVPAVPPGALTGPGPRYNSTGGKEYYKTKLTGPGALSWLLSEMHRVKTPPEESIMAPSAQAMTVMPEKHQGAAAGGKKRSVFKHFFDDLRHGSSADIETPEPVTMRRRDAIAQRTSMATLLQKVSKPQLNKLKRKASQATVSTARQAIRPKPSLDVTHFEQTPFTQRYGNTIKAERSLIKSYIEEALNDDDNDDVQLGFELDVPDHLPNSPLCPLNPKHKSGGRAICPLHGRKKRLSPMVSRATTKVEPRIVYESKTDDRTERTRSSAGERAEGTKRQRFSYDLGDGNDGAWYS